jgi:hypothetical protein
MPARRPPETTLSLFTGHQHAPHLARSREQAAAAVAPMPAGPSGDRRASARFDSIHCVMLAGALQRVSGWLAAAATAIARARREPVLVGRKSGRK